MGAKRLGGKRLGGKRLGGETTRGRNGLGAKRPGFMQTLCFFGSVTFPLESRNNLPKSTYSSVSKV